MTAKLTADRLLEFAKASLDELAPAYAPEQRHLVAMIGRAMQIAAREIRDPGDDAVWSLLDAIYDDGEGSPAVLAQDIRAGTVSAATHPSLRAALKRIVIAEVKVRNPQFLVSRSVKG
jgi:Domain of unknown function (DUF6285)